MVCRFRLTSAGKYLKSLQPEPKDAGRQRFDGLAIPTFFRVDLPIGEVVPMVDDQEVFLLLARDGVGPCPRSSADHLPELDLTENRLGKDQITDRGDVDSGIKHVDGDRNSGKVAILEVVQRLLSTLHVTINDLGQSAPLQIGIEPIEALVDFQCVIVTDGKDDGLGGQRAGRVFDGNVHEFADDRVVRPGVCDTPFKVGAIKIQF